MQKSAGKLAGQLADLDGDDAEPVKKRRKLASRAVRPTVMSQFKGVDVSKVVKVSEVTFSQHLMFYHQTAFCMVTSHTVTEILWEVKCRCYW